MVKVDGSPATESDLSDIDDQIYVVSRKNQVGTVVLPNDESTPAFEGSLDEYLTSPIQQRLVAMNPNNVYLSSGTVVTVKFPNGVTANFIKTCQCSDMWHWTGEAWDAQGRRVYRDGQAISYDLSPSWSDGTVITTTNFARDYRFQASPLCTIGTTVTDYAGGVTYTVSRYVPC